MATWYVSTTGNDSTGTGASGAPYLTISKAVSVASSGDTIAVKSDGTYTITAAINIPSTLASLTIQGYQTTAGDNGTKPLITTATNSVDIFTTNSTTGVQLFDNLSLSNTAATRGNGIVQLSAHGTSQWWVVRNCLFDGFTTGINSDNVGAHFDVSNIAVTATEIKNCSVYSINSNTGTLHIHGCYLHAATGQHIKTNTGCALSMERTIVAGATSTSAAISPANTVRISNCAIVNNSGDGIFPSSGGSTFVMVENTIFYGNGGYGLHGATGTTWTASAMFSRNNAFGSNTSGAYFNWNGSPGDVTLTANPFTSSGTGDYSLNSTTGGGALLKGAGYPGAFPGGTSTGTLDIGAVQSAASGGGSSSAGGSYCFVF